MAKPQEFFLPPSSSPNPATPAYSASSRPTCAPTPTAVTGYVEGWYVVESQRRHGIGTALLRAAEDWARTQGSTEMASDTQLENFLSQRAHTSLGFEVAERSILYRKPL